MKLQIKLTLKSDGTFGRGDGVAGLLDQEVEHDAATGLPFLRGRTLKGLLAEECANFLYALSKQNPPDPDYEKSKDAARFLFGIPGSTLDDDAHMHVGPALLPEDLRKAVDADLRQNTPRYSPTDILESLTAIRRQTAVDTGTEAPDEGSLRSIRVVFRDTTFIADVELNADAPPHAMPLLAACVLSLRRAGTARNRGRGKIEARLCDDRGADITKPHFDQFGYKTEAIR
ncbi:MAG: RAMP superfamily protein [Acidobacteriia bacterium]|nr:RAMP superfamily protein [Terriglobia bacterium]